MSTLFSTFFENYNKVSPQEGEFTEVLTSIAVVPKMLYFYGKIPAKRVKTVAIVGSRKPTKYGQKIAYDLAFQAAKRGAIVISGLAYGIDSIAARGALDAGGVTIAVLGTPIDRIYPEAHLKLAAEIVQKGGAIISERAPGESFHFKTCFLERNRLISGLADAVVIPEAAARSGSLNTAAHALEQGKEVFAVPGNLTSPLSAGCNRLIKQGANPYLEPDDVLNFLFPEAQKNAQAKLLFGDNHLETALLRAINLGVMDGEVLGEKLKIDMMTLNRNLTVLELKGRIQALGANQWTIKA